MMHDTAPAADSRETRPESRSRQENASRHDVASRSQRGSRSATPRASATPKQISTNGSMASVKADESAYTWGVQGKQPDTPKRMMILARTPQSPRASSARNSAGNLISSDRDASAAAGAQSNVAAQEPTAPKQLDTLKPLVPTAQPNGLVRGNPSNTGYKYVNTDGHSYINSRTSIFKSADDAATRVQAAYRGFRSRRASTQGRIGADSGEKGAYEDESYITEETSKESLNDKASAKENSHQDSEDGIGDLAPRRFSRDQAATKVQSAFRGFRVRKMSNIFIPPQMLKLDSETEDQIIEEVEKSMRDLSAIPPLTGTADDKEDNEELKPLSRKTISTQAIEASMSGLLTRSSINLDESHEAQKIQSLFRGYQVRRSFDGDAQSGSLKVRESLNSVYKSFEAIADVEKEVDTNDSVDTDEDADDEAEKGRNEAEESLISENSNADVIPDLDYYDDLDDPNPETMDAITGKDEVIRKLSILQQNLRDSTASAQGTDTLIGSTTYLDSCLTLTESLGESTLDKAAAAGECVAEVSSADRAKEEAQARKLLEEAASSLIAKRAVDSLKTSMVSISSKRSRSTNDPASVAVTASALSSKIKVNVEPGSGKKSNGSSKGSIDLLSTDRIGRTFSITGGVSAREMIAEPKSLKPSLKHGQLGVAASNGEISKSRVSFRNLAEGLDDDNGVAPPPVVDSTSAVMPAQLQISVSSVKAEKERPQSAVHLRKTKRRPTSALSGRYNQTVKFSGFEFQRMPGVEAMADQLVDQQRAEMEHMNRLIVLRLTNPWSALTNSDVLFQEAAWESIKKQIAAKEAVHLRSRPRSAHARFSGNAMASVVQLDEPLAPPPHLADVKPTVPKQVREPLPPSVRMAHTKMSPIDWARIDELSKPRRRAKPITPERALAAMLDARKSKKLKPMDPVIFARLTKPRRKSEPEPELPVPVKRPRSAKRVGNALLKHKSEEAKPDDVPGENNSDIQARDAVPDFLNAAEREAATVSNRDLGASVKEDNSTERKMVNSNGIDEDLPKELQKSTSEQNERQILPPGSQGSLDVFNFASGQKLNDENTTASNEIPDEYNTDESPAFLDQDSQSQDRGVIKNINGTNNIEEDISGDVAENSGTRAKNVNHPVRSLQNLSSSVQQIVRYESNIPTEKQTNPTPPSKNHSGFQSPARASSVKGQLDAGSKSQSGSRNFGPAQQIHTL